MSGPVLQIDLVRQYLQQTRVRGQAAIKEFLLRHGADSVDTKDASSILHSWCIYHLANSDLEIAAFNELLEADRRAANFDLSVNILEPNLVEYDAGKRLLFRRACEILQTAWPQFYELMQVIQPRLYLPRSPRPESVSDVKTFGQVHFNMRRQTPVEWVEILVHEMGHHYLFVIYAAFHKRVPAPWDQLVHSAIRGEDRPLVGVMHAVVAETFMVYAAWRILQESSLSAEHADAKALLGRMAPNLLRDYATAAPFGVFAMEPTLSHLIESAVHIAKQSEECR